MDDRKRALGEASEWLLRLQEESLADADIETWSRWMAASPAHARAFDDLSALWEVSAGLSSEMMQRARAEAERDASAQPAPLRQAPASASPAPPSQSAASQPEVAHTTAATHPTASQANAFQAPRRGAQRPRRRSGWLAAGIAATLGILAIGFFAGGFLPSGPTTSEAAPVRIATEAGERRHVRLPDGSTMDLDASSEVVLRFGVQRRDIALTKGRAYFDVAHDASRPFEVLADRVVSRAVGTRFSVSHRAQQEVAVAVGQGRVQVRLSDSDGGRAIAGQARMVEAGVDQQVSYRVDGGLQGPRRIDAEAVVSWRQGSMTYQAESLANVIEDLNRYSSLPIRLQDPALGRLLVTGRWDSASVDRWVEGLARALGLRLERQRDQILLRAPVAQDAG
ncbi:FecR family protein [Luteimonas sp. RIT-PG2_3]